MTHTVMEADKSDICRQQVGADSGQLRCGSRPKASRLAASEKPEFQLESKGRKKLTPARSQSCRRTPVLLVGTSASLFDSDL